MTPDFRRRLVAATRMLPTLGVDVFRYQRGDKSAVIPYPTVALSPVAAECRLDARAPHGARDVAVGSRLPVTAESRVRETGAGAEAVCWSATRYTIAS